MAQKQVPAAGQPERLLAGLFDAIRNLTYASVGIVGAVGEEAEAAYRRSILRGRGRVQKVGRRLGLRTGAAAEPVTVEGEVASARKAGSDDLRSAISRLNLADPSDMDALRRQVAELEARVNQLTGE